MAVTPTSANGISSPISGRPVVVASDLDGTIWADSHVVNSTKAMIKKLIDSGVTLFPVTGRDEVSARRILDAVGLPSYPAGYHHGAITIGPDGKIINKITIPKSVLPTMKRAVNRMEVERDVHCAILIQCPVKRYLMFHTSKYAFKCTKWLWEEPLEPADSMTPDDEDEIIQCSILQSVEVPHQVANWQKQVLAEELARDQIDSVHSISGHPWLIDCINKDAHKGTALNLLAVQMGFELEDVVALGDNENDIAMLKAAGRSVAMGGSEKLVCDAATLVTNPILEDGWANAVEKLVFAPAQR